jgi:membrane protein
MLGLYVFWLFVLVGGQISYAIQNVHFRNSQAAWSNLSEFTRERLTLAVLLTIARRFQACLPPCTVSELGGSIKVPTQVLNECLNRLIDLGMISPIPPEARSGSTDYLYQPARPLNRITLQEFKHAFENHGHDPASEGLGKLDPVGEKYQETLAAIESAELLTTPLDELFERYSFDLPSIGKSPDPVAARRK